MEDQQVLPPARPPTPARQRNVEMFKSPFKRFNKFTGVPVQHSYPFRPAKPDHTQSSSSSSWYQAGDRWGHRRSNSFSEADGDQSSEKVVGSRRGIPAVKKTEGQSQLTAEPDILRGLASLSLD